MNETDRITGCILGGAIGDCFGGPYEGSSSPVIIENTHEWKLSDDTQLTMATCEAISDGIVNPALIAESFAAWFRDSRITGVGAATYKALSELSQGAHWALVGMKGERSAGNGPAMRIAPLAFCLDPREPSARVVIRDTCRITHHNDEAYAGALAVALALRATWEGSWLGQDDLISLPIRYLPDTRVRDRLIEFSQIEGSTPLLDIAKRFGCSGYVVESVPLALCGAIRLGKLGFELMMRELVSVGGDTDTIASMAGQIAGALVGQDGLPRKMLERLPDLNMIRGLSERFAKRILAS